MANGQANARYSGVSFTIARVGVVDVHDVFSLGSSANVLYGW